MILSHSVNMQTLYCLM